MRRNLRKPDAGYGGLCGYSFGVRWLATALLYRVSLSVFICVYLWFFQLLSLFGVRAPIPGRSAGRLDISGVPK
jgi:hypothetical protein